MFYSLRDYTSYEGIRIDYNRSTRKVFEEATISITRYIKSSFLKPYPNYKLSDSLDIGLLP